MSLQAFSSLLILAITKPLRSFMKYVLPFGNVLQISEHFRMSDILELIIPDAISLVFLFIAFVAIKTPVDPV